MTHGAGSHARCPLLRALDRSFTQAGVRVVLHDLAFRRARPSGPPRAGDGQKDRDDLRESLRPLRGAGPVYAGGVSYGGRMLSMVAAADPAACDALLLLSYPLHPPGRPGQLRTAHLPALRTPVLFTHGDRDPFGGIGELRLAMQLLAGPARLLVVDKAGHDLRGLAPDAVARDFLEFVSGQGG